MVQTQDADSTILIHLPVVCGEQPSQGALEFVWNRPSGARSTSN